MKEACLINNIIFAGTPAIAANLLADLIASGCHISACFTRPDKPRGRHQQLIYSAVKHTAIINHIPVLQPETLKNSDIIKSVQQLQPDIMIVFAYGLILPPEILMIPKFGCFNVHTSLLPKWRGAAPVQHAILAGDTLTGISIIKMAAGLDTGDVCYRLECPISNIDTSESIYTKLQPLASTAILQVIQQLQHNQLNLTPQNHTLATYATKFNKLDAKIDWSLPAEHIDRMVRAFIPAPVAFTEIGKVTYDNSQQPNHISIRIWQASIVDFTLTSNSPGNIIDINKHGITVATGCGVLRLEKVQFSGGKILSVADLLNSPKYKTMFAQHLSFN